MSDNYYQWSKIKQNLERMLLINVKDVYFLKKQIFNENSRKIILEILGSD